MSDLANPSPQGDGIQIVKDGDKVNIIMDMSIFDTFQLCPQRYDYRHGQNREVPISKKSPALDKGGVMHEGFDVYFSLLKEGKHFNDRMHAAIMKIREVSSDPNQSNLDPDEVNALIVAIEASCDYWRFEDETLEILSVETPFAYILYEDEHVRIIITGKIDLFVNMPSIGGRTEYKGLPIDHKSYQRDSPVLRMTNQFQNYCVATNSNYLYVNRVGLQTSLTADEKYKRIPLSYDKDILQQWKDNTTRVILQEYLTCVAEQYWPMRPTSCLAFNRLCEYYEVCDTSGKEAKLYKLNSEFATVSPWDVTAVLKKDFTK